MNDHTRPALDRDYLLLFQEILPDGLRLLRRQHTDIQCGDVFVAEDDRGGVTSPTTRTVRFLPPEHRTPDDDGWTDWPNWQAAFVERVAQFVGCQMPHLTLPSEVVSTASGVVYIVTSYHEPLLNVGRGHVAPQLAVVVLEQLLDGIAALHAHGLAHGDIRPDNIFIDGDPARGQLTVWLGDPVAGILQRCSGKGSFVSTRTHYYPAVLDSVSPTDDLYALAKMANSLVSPADGEPADEGDDDVSVKHLWDRCRATLAHAGLHDARGPFRLAGFLSPNYECCRQLSEVVAILLDQPTNGWIGSWLNWSFSNQEPVAPKTAGDVVARIRRNQLRRASARRMLAVVCAICIVALATASVAAVFWGRSESARTRVIAAEWSQTKEGLENARGEVEKQQTQIAELRQRLDEKEVSDRVRELKDISAGLERVLQALPRAPSAPVEPAALSSRAKAQNTWRQEFEKTKYSKAAAQSLFERLSRGSDKEVANLVKKWKQGTKGDGGVDGLRRSAEPWLATDSQLKLLVTQAQKSPWEKLDEATRRLEVLLTAAREWEKCGNPDTSLQAVIDTEPDDDVKKVLKEWNQKLQTTSTWSLHLDRGETALGADLADDSRIVTLYAEATVKGATHHWAADSATPPHVKFAFDYSHDKLDGVSILDFRWHTRKNQSLQLYVERDLNYYFNNLIEGEVFSGPLAIWLFDQASPAKSADGNTTLSYHVTATDGARCPGPPRGWNVSRISDQQIKAKLSEVTIEASK